MRKLGLSKGSHETGKGIIFIFIAIIAGLFATGCSEHGFVPIWRLCGITLTDTEGNVTLLLYNIGNDVRTVEFCVTNTLRRRVLTFASADVSSAVGDTIYLDAGEVDASMYAAIQHDVFNNTCAQCHGLSTTAAAGLYLTEGQSHGSLVNQPATSAEGTRVIPGNAEESVLHKVIRPGNELELGFSHEGMITSSITLRLIDEWINAGAKE